MRILSLIVILVFFNFCTENKNQDVVVQEGKQRILKPEFQAIIDSANLIGSILIFDHQAKTFFSNDFEWSKKGQLPASTYKIPHSIIALETGIVENDSTLFEWHGEERALAIWEQDLSFKDAFQYSCVPCYQEVARKIGVQRMKSHLEKLNYGTIEIDSATIANFWLIGESKINQFQQIDFLARFYESELPISERTETIMKSIMLIEDKRRYKISGKTGWSVVNDHNNGWFVGYLETADTIYYFASNVEPKNQSNTDSFLEGRKAVVYDAFKIMAIIN